MLVSAGLVTATTARRIEHPRIAADYPETHVGDAATALRFSDRDPVVAYIATDALSLADLAITNVAAPNPVVAGQNLTYTITVPTTVRTRRRRRVLTDTLPASTTFVSLSTPGGWSCTTPAVGAGGSISCSTASMSVGGADVHAHGRRGAVGNRNHFEYRERRLVDQRSDAGQQQQRRRDTGGWRANDHQHHQSDDCGRRRDGSCAVHHRRRGYGAGQPHALGRLVESVNRARRQHRPRRVGRESHGHGHASRQPHGGPVTITVTVSDGGFSSSDTFTLSVTSVNDAPTIDPIANQTVGVNVTVGPLPIAIADVDHAASSLTLSAVSSNHALVPDTAIAFGGSGGDRTVTITPLSDQSGETTITVTVSDGVTATSTAFVLTVTPRPPLTYFLAEGATGDFFDEDLLIANPNDSAAPVTVTFYPGSRASIVETRTIPARSGLRLQVDALPGLEAAAVSAQVRSDSGVPLAVERTQFWGAGSYGGHTETALAGAATRWYFAEGAQGYFTTFVLVANPQPVPVDLTLTFLREGETPVTTTVQVAPFSRTTIPAASLPELADRAFGIIVDATQPVVAERAMYFGTTAARPWTGGAAAAGFHDAVLDVVLRRRRHGHVLRHLHPADESGWRRRCARDAALPAGQRRDRRRAQGRPRSRAAHRQHRERN